MSRFRSAAASLALALIAPAVSAQSVLIINGASGTSEPNTTASITSQLQTLHTAVGNTVTIADGVPVSLAGFAQVWDIRFSNSSPISTAVRAQYLAYLQGGGRMFVMGENSSFATRNNSIFALINEAGGGSLGFSGNCSSSQTVNAPFTGPNAVTSVDYLAPGCFDGRGTGQWITNSGSTGAGVAWTIGTLANASAGALTSILDVNFMQTDANAGSQALTRNLIGFVTAPPPPVGVVPEPSTYALMATGLAGLAAVRRRRARS